MPLRNSLIVAAWCAACASFAAAEGPAVRMLVQSSPLAGFRYHEAAIVWAELRLGDTLQLAREPDNPYDGQAVSVWWRGRKLGYVPRRQNAALAWALDRGASLHARISRLTDHPNPARRLEFEVLMD
ncbi:MAG: HIRAN domain-containing protein [Betaproteobacteria bacterium]|nr:HIRAN domain-containing protein [Betaproteobacteria bacterium]